MKKSILFVAIVFLFNNVFSQGNEYLVFEFMKVANDQELSYMETEDFWEKIHTQRIKNGNIIGWDLWSLESGDEEQQFQYLTVAVYDDSIKMFSNSLDFGSALNDAYPELTDVELDEKFNKTSKSRELALRLYLEIIDGTTDDFNMEKGTIANIEFMNSMGNIKAYEKAEIEIFLPLHQKAVDNGKKGNWSLISILPQSVGDIKASHLTINMYKGVEEYLKSQESIESLGITPELNKKIIDGLKTRDVKRKYIATLIKKVR
jgi:hypothetical protein